MDGYFRRKHGSINNNDIHQYVRSIWYDAAVDIYVRKSDIRSWRIGSSLFKFSYVRCSIGYTIGCGIINSTILASSAQYFGTIPETIVDVVTCIHSRIRHRYEPLFVRIVLMAG